MNKLILCLFLAGCSAGVNPAVDFGTADAAEDGSSSVDAGPELGEDAGDPPDLTADASSDAGSDTDAGDPDLGPPDLGTDAGPPACIEDVDPPVTLCPDGRCCAGSCDACVPVSGGFCTCYHMHCSSGTECAFGDMVCPCR